jgi:hypothetical protein
VLFQKKKLHFYSYMPFLCFLCCLIVLFLNADGATLKLTNSDMVRQSSLGLCSSTSLHVLTARTSLLSAANGALPGGNIVRFSHDQTFHLPDATRYHNSCGGWLLLSRDDDSCFMLNPFTNATVQLPSLSSYICYNEHVETVNVLADEMPVTWMNIKDLADISVITLIVCSKHLIAAIVAINGLGTIALCRPGAAAWSVSAHEQCMWLSDMVFFQGCSMLLTPILRTFF